MSCKFLTLLITIAVAIICSLSNISQLVVASDEQLTNLAMENRELRQADLVEDMQDPIKYLERLDKIYSQMTRPRFGRSTGGILASKPHPSQVSLEKTRQSMRLALLEAAASRAANLNPRTKLGLANLISLASQSGDLDL